MLEQVQPHLNGLPEGIKSSGRLLVDWEIRDYVKKYQMLDPFEERLVRDGKISYGLSSMGYDIRVTETPGTKLAAAQAAAPAKAAAKIPVTNGYTNPMEQQEQVTFVAQADAPACAECGSIMVRNAACYKCLNCGCTSGCS